MSEVRNMNPHAEAEIARILWATKYAFQYGGIMDFWDSLDPRRKEYCVCIMNDLESLPRCKDWKEPEDEKTICLRL